MDVLLLWMVTIGWFGDTRIWRNSHVQNNPSPHPRVPLPSCSFTVAKMEKPKGAHNARCQSNAPLIHCCGWLGLANMIIFKNSMDWSTILFGNPHFLDHEFCGPQPVLTTGGYTWRLLVFVLVVFASMKMDPHGSALRRWFSRSTGRDPWIVNDGTSPNVRF